MTQVEKPANWFAIKAAVLKVLGIGWKDGVAFTDDEVVSLVGGAPTIQLRRHLRALGTGKIRRFNVQNFRGIKNWE